MKTRGAVVENLVRVCFCGEEYVAEAGCQFTAGREVDLALDGNLYLHCRFLQIGWMCGLGPMHHIGTRMVVTVAGSPGMLQALLVQYAIFLRLVSGLVSGTDLYLFDEEFAWNATPQKAAGAGILGGGQEGSK